MPKHNGVKMTFAEVEKHPLFQTERIDSLLTVFPIMQQNLPLAKLLPITNVPSYKVTIDVDIPIRGGMTPAVAAGAESPIFQYRHRRARKELEGIEWREKIMLTEDELYDLREIGTMAQYTTARQHLARKYRDLEMRAVNRLEYMRYQVLFENKVTYELDGVMEEVNYTHPAHLEYSANTDWDEAAADPLDDIQLWIEHYKRYSGFYLTKMIAPLGTFRRMLKNTKFIDTAKNSYGAFIGSTGAIQTMFLDHCGFRIEEDHSRMEESADILADVSATGTSLLLAGASVSAALKVGSVVVLKNPISSLSETRTVASVTRNANGTVTVGVDALVNAYPAGTAVKWFMDWIPANKMLLIGAPLLPLDLTGTNGTPDASSLSNWGDLASTLSHYSDMMNPRPGFFTKVIDKLGEDAPRIEQVLGIRAIPRIHYPEGWATAEIF